jgi:hypothetical protein
MSRRAGPAVLAAWLVLCLCLLALAARGGSRGRIASATVGPDPGPGLLPPATILPITPTPPVTPTRLASWYPTTESYFLEPELTARQATFAPGAFSMAFTLNKAAEGAAPDVYVALAGPDGELTRQVQPLAGLPGGAAALCVKASNAAGLYAVGSAGEEAALLPGRYDDLWLVSADGSRIWRVTDGHRRLADFWWLPDGQSLSFLDSQGQLVVRDLETEQEEVLARGLYAPSGAAAVNLSWAPDGSAVALGTAGGADLGGRVELVARGTGTRTSLAEFSEPGMPLPVFSPDGQTVYAFVTDGRDTSKTKLYALGVAPGPGVTALADLGVEGRSAWVESAVPDPAAPYLYFVQAGAVRRVAVDGSGLAEVVSRGTEVVRGDLSLQALPNGGRRLGWVASTYQGASAAPSGQQSATTTFQVHSLSLDEPKPRKTEAGS